MPSNQPGSTRSSSGWWTAGLFQSIEVELLHAPTTSARSRSAARRRPTSCAPRSAALDHQIARFDSLGYVSGEELADVKALAELSTPRSVVSGHRDTHTLSAFGGASRTWEYYFSYDGQHGGSDSGGTWPPTPDTLHRRQASRHWRTHRAGRPCRPRINRSRAYRGDPVIGGPRRVALRLGAAPAVATRPPRPRHPRERYHPFHRRWDSGDSPARRLQRRGLRQRVSPRRRAASHR